MSINDAVSVYVSVTQTSNMQGTKIFSCRIINYHSESIITRDIVLHHMNAPSSSRSSCLLYRAWLLLLLPPLTSTGCEICTRMSV